MGRRASARKAPSTGLTTETSRENARQQLALIEKYTVKPARKRRYRLPRHKLIVLGKRALLTAREKAKKLLAELHSAGVGVGSDVKELRRLEPLSDPAQPFLPGIDVHPVKPYTGGHLRKRTLMPKRQRQRRRSRHAVSRRAKDAVAIAGRHLMTGKRLEVNGKTPREVFYLGSSTENRRDPFWLEHSGGRTYAERPEPLLEKILPHVGTEAIEKAKIHRS
jgi:hypothetical protein